MCIKLMWPAGERKEERLASPTALNIEPFDESAKFPVVHFKQSGGGHLAAVCLLQCPRDKLFFKLFKREEFLRLHRQNDIAG